LSNFRHPKGDPAQILLQIDSIAETFKRQAPSLLDLPAAVFDDSDSSIHRIAQALTRERRDFLLLSPTEAHEQASLLSMLIIHGAVYVWRCIARNHGASWSFRQPLWESSVMLRSALGEGELHPFSWWVKSLADEEIDQTKLAYRYRSYVEVPCFDASALPVIVESQRAVPRLKTPVFE